MKSYTGIGSRSTPERVQYELMNFAFDLAQTDNWTLRSGKAKGADTAFQVGVQQYLTLHSDTVVDPYCEIYTPWRNFRGEGGVWDTWDISDIPKECMDIMSQIHPYWEKCTSGARKLHARNVCQVLGRDLQTPSEFVVFYAEEKMGKVKGGTATAVNLAKEHGIPTYNWYKKSDVRDLFDYLEENI